LNRVPIRFLSGRNQQSQKKGHEKRKERVV
jgi:hypothetical protein